jgi:uncharacterized membrane protein YbaN (DUF454 family)
LRRATYLLCGLLAIALGVIGIFLPVLPTVPFLLVAAFCFARSRPEWAERLYNHPRYGPPLRQWRDRKSIGRKAKYSALAAMAAGAAISWLTIGWPVALGVSAVLVVTGSWIWTRPE